MSTLHLEAALVLALLTIALLYFLPNPECVCANCSFHIHKRAEKKQRQRELAHDTQHKGWGFREGAPDRFNCEQDECSRNREVR